MPSPALVGTLLKVCVALLAMVAFACESNTGGGGWFPPGAGTPQQPAGGQADAGGAGGTYQATPPGSCMRVTVCDGGKACPDGSTCNTYMSPAMCQVPGCAGVGVMCGADEHCAAVCPDGSGRCAEGTEQLRCVAISYAGRIAGVCARSTALAGEPCGQAGIPGGPGNRCAEGLVCSDGSAGAANTCVSPAPVGPNPDAGGGTVGWDAGSGGGVGDPGGPAWDLGGYRPDVVSLPDVSPPADGEVGAPCETNEHCDTGMCLSAEMMAEIGLEGVHLPGGMCSKPCEGDGSCGDLGLCSEASRWIGVPFSLCLRRCMSSHECRHAEGYGCWRLDAGDMFGGCVPNYLAEEMGCRDGVCPDPDNPDPDPDPDPDPGSEGAIGDACATNTDCTHGMCMNDDLLRSIGMDTEGMTIPNGMCIKLPCNSDAECGSNGTCVDASVLVGSTPGGIDMRACLRACEENADCRWEEGYVCYYAELDGVPPVCVPGSFLERLP